MKVGYLGPEATFTHGAVQAFFSGKESIPYATIPDCMDAVAKGEITCAVVPLENAIEGSVNITIDYLVHEQPLHIVGEIAVPIKQHLAVHPINADNWRNVERVLSHPHALAQCHKFLHTYVHGAVLEQMTSTSAGAKYVAEHEGECIAAVCNEFAVEHYGLQIVAHDIHTYKGNYTRFIILAKGEEALSHAFIPYTGEKSTWMITLPFNQAGALHQVLSAFSWRKLNLSKIESRPMKTGLGNYFFLIDVEQTWDEVLMRGAKEELEALGCGVTIIGRYSCYVLHTEMENSPSM
ncbi:prephenate dehydratase [Priestia taiwanensis]|uniref:Prephenate dehydratase n=1 Tax=Priestia taiwanensis TaxID=1347902 RepID=A0A917AU28_9BACI|nr:prephenate dehydratase [Priestia taiwanensis]MBM7363624.1 prephenate dehydratase [Priestia taiwanensis]GGE75501.1 prephenate dehydratase [Priestia taiwanensis]